jgi:hypothetical protein
MTVLIVGVSASVVVIQRMLLFVVIWFELNDEFRSWEPSWESLKALRVVLRLSLRDSHLF